MDKYAVIGNPIDHSKSPQIHQAFAQQEKAEIDYQKILADEDKFTSTANEFFTSGGLGLNVTVPFKITAFEQCQQLSTYAKAAGAVNTISFDPVSGWRGANTDGIGLLNDLKINQQLHLAGKHILILGAGGASRGILLPLLEEHPASILLINRTVSKATELANNFSIKGNIIAGGFNDVEDKPYDLIINATSASLTSDIPPVFSNTVGPDTVCYDLAYSDKPTAFLKWSMSLNAKKSIDGIGMLIEQAAESYYIWRKFRPNTSEVFKILRPGS